MYEIAFYHSVEAYLEFRLPLRLLLHLALHRLLLLLHAVHSQLQVRDPGTRREITARENFKFQQGKII